MKKLLKNLLCIVIVFATISSLASCECGVLIRFGKYDDTYTGGFQMSDVQRAHIELYWFETYEEVEPIIDALIANGSNIWGCNFIPTYENEIVDAKYCIQVNGAKSPKRGQKWYDRTLSEVYVEYYGFLDTVSIEKLEHSYHSRYRSIHFSGRKYEGDKLPDCNTVTYELDEEWLRYVYELSDANMLGYLYYYQITGDDPFFTEEFHKEFIGSIKWVYGNKSE